MIIGSPLTARLNGISRNNYCSCAICVQMTPVPTFLYGASSSLEVPKSKILVKTFQHDFVIIYIIIVYPPTQLKPKEQQRGAPVYTLHNINVLLFMCSRTHAVVVERGVS